MFIQLTLSPRPSADNALSGYPGFPVGKHPAIQINVAGAEFSSDQEPADINSQETCDNCA
jgi:hypothetical protein